MGYLKIVPGAPTLLQSFKNFTLNHLKQLKGYAKSAYTIVKEDVALSKYESGKIEVTLRFGTIKIPINSKITV